MFPQNNDTYRTPDMRSQETTPFHSGDQLDFKVGTSEGAKSFAEIRDIDRTTQLASDLAISSVEAYERKPQLTIEDARWESSNIVAFRKHVIDSQLNIFDEAA